MKRILILALTLAPAMAQANAIRMAPGGGQPRIFGLPAAISFSASLCRCVVPDATLSAPDMR